VLYSIRFNARIKIKSRVYTLLISSRTVQGNYEGYQLDTGTVEAIYLYANKWHESTVVKINSQKTTNIFSNPVIAQKTNH